MQVLQWSMTIPESKHKEFVKWFKETAGPTFAKFGAKRHEIYKVAEKEIIGKQITEEDRFIERVFFDNDFDLPSYFAKVKADPEAWKLSKMYEEKFSAIDIELKVLREM